MRYHGSILDIWVQVDRGLAGALLCVRAAELTYVGVDNKLSNWCSNAITISRNKVCV
jgi:hypothetical protein